VQPGIEGAFEVDIGATQRALIDIRPVPHVEYQASRAGFIAHVQSEEMVASGSERCVCAVCDGDGSEGSAFQLNQTGQDLIEVG
jgi:predicted deacylase